MREGPCPCPNYPARPGLVYDSFSRSSQAFGAPFLSDDIPSLRRILAETRVIAMVGLSASWYRPSLSTPVEDSAKGRRKRLPPGLVV